MIRVYVGALLVIAGIAAFIEAHSHRPSSGYAGLTPAAIASEIQWGTPPIRLGLSQTDYDLLHIGAFALMLLGVLTIVLGLIRYAQRASGSSVLPEQQTPVLPPDDSSRQSARQSVSSSSP